MALDRVLDDGEAEPRPPGAPGTSRIGTVEPFEDAFLIALADADAAVGDRDLHDGVGQGDPDADLGSARRIGDGVGDEVPDRFTEHLGVAAHVQTALASAHDTDPRGIREDRVGVDSGGDDLVDGDVTLVRELIGGLQARQVQDARGQLRQA